MIAEPHRAAAIGWFPLDRLPTPTVAHEAAVLTELDAGRIRPIMTWGFEPSSG